MAAFAEVSDVTLANGSTPAGPNEVVERELTIASARLRRLMPGIDVRVLEDPDVLGILVTEVIVQAVLRRLKRNGEGVAEVSAMTQSAGPFSTTMNFRGPRNDFFTLEELALLRPPVVTLGIGSIDLGMADWAPGSAGRPFDAR